VITSHAKKNAHLQELVHLVHLKFHLCMVKGWWEMNLLGGAMQSLATTLVMKFVGLMFIGLLCLSVNASEVRADAAWKNIRGHSACGGIDQYGKLQPPCGFKKATYIKKAIKSCPKGTFAGAGACYTCPTGFKRNTLRKVTHEKACRKAISAKTAAASRIGSAKCPSGSKFDPRNGGECWSCPSGFGRTAAKVDKWNACGKVGKKAQSATFKKRACPDRKSTRLNSSHLGISYAVFCLKKKNKQH